MTLAAKRDEHEHEHEHEDEWGAVAAVKLRGGSVLVGTSRGAVLWRVGTSTRSRSNADGDGDADGGWDAAEVVVAAAAAGSRGDAVVGVDLDETGTWAAWATRSGSVVVKQAVVSHRTGVVTAVEERHAARFVDPVAHVALDPRVAARAAGNSGLAAAFVTDTPAGGVMLSSKAWFMSRSRELYVPTSKADGHITSLAWRGDLVAAAHATASDGLVVDVLDAVQLTKAVRLGCGKPALGLGHGPPPLTRLAWADDTTLLACFPSELLIARINSSTLGYDAWVVARVDPRPGTTLLGAVPLSYSASALASAAGTGNLKAVWLETDGIALSVAVAYGAPGQSTTTPTPSPPTLLCNVADVGVDPSTAALLLADGYGAPNDPAASALVVDAASKLPLAHVLLPSAKPHATCISFRSRTIDDVVETAIANGDYEAAWSVCEAHKDVVRVSSRRVADAWLASLLGKEDYDAIARVLRRTCSASSSPENADVWAKWCSALSERRALAALAAVLPVPRPPALASAFYDLALKSLLDAARDVEAAAVIRSWHAARVDFDAALASSFLERLLAKEPPTSMRTPELRACLALCYAASDRDEDAFWELVESGPAMHADAFALLELRPAVLLASILGRARLPDVVRLGEDRAVAFLATAVRRGLVTTNAVVDPLLVNGLELASLKLLRRLSSSGGASSSSSSTSSSAITATTGTSAGGGQTNTSLGDLAVDLCARLEPTRLLELLRDSNDYSPTKALATCRRLGLQREVVFLLGRVGGPDNAREAISILVSKLKDVEAALRLAQDRDADWDTLVEQCSASPELVAELLRRAGRFSVEPARLVRAVPPGMRIPRARDLLQRLFSDADAQAHARVVADKIVRHDASAVVRSFHRQVKRGVKVRVSTEDCSLCGCSLAGASGLDFPAASASPISGDDALVVFRSGDVYHSACLARVGRIVAASSGGSGGSEHLQTTQHGQSSVQRKHALVFVGAFSLRSSS